MSAFPVLLRRELWENRGAFYTTPLVIACLVVVGSILVVTFAATFIDNIDQDQAVVAFLANKTTEIDPQDWQLALTVVMNAIGGIFNMVLFFVVFFYLLGALYDDRRDRSVLFWKSLPVSDLATTLSKLAAAGLLAPVFTFTAIVATHIVVAAIFSIAFLLVGVSPWEHIWSAADPLAVWARNLVAYLIQGLWMLPVWGWLLLASAFARSKPFLWAVVPWVLLATIQSWSSIFFSFRFNDHWVWQLIGERLAGGVVPLGLTISDDELSAQLFNDGEIQQVPGTIQGTLARLADNDLWWGIVFGAVCVAAAVYIRRYRDDS